MVFLVCISAFEVLFYERFSDYSHAIVSVCLMAFLGFADDVLDLRWAVKIALSGWATMPLLISYVQSGAPTNVILPKPLRVYFGLDVELGPLYLLYMILWAIFCTNSINIYAGVNGLEVGQSVVIAVAILVHNLIELGNPRVADDHLFSMYLMIPFLCVSLAPLVS